MELSVHACLAMYLSGLHYVQEHQERLKVAEEEREAAALAAAQAAANNVAAAAAAAAAGEPVGAPAATVPVRNTNKVCLCRWNCCILFSSCADLHMVCSHLACF